MLTLAILGSAGLIGSGGGRGVRLKVWRASKFGFVFCFLFAGLSPSRMGCVL